MPGRFSIRTGVVCAVVAVFLAACANGELYLADKPEQNFKSPETARLGSDRAAFAQHRVRRVHVTSKERLIEAVKAFANQRDLTVEDDDDDRPPLKADSDVNVLLFTPTTVANLPQLLPRLPFYVGLSVVTPGIVMMVTQGMTVFLQPAETAEAYYVDVRFWYREHKTGFLADNITGETREVDFELFDPKRYDDFFKQLEKTLGTKAFRIDNDDPVLTTLQDIPSTRKLAKCFWDDKALDYICGDREEEPERPGQIENAARKISSKLF